MDYDDPKALIDALREENRQLREALKHSMCFKCFDEHGENPQSISCYCDCHDSRRDRERWRGIRRFINAVMNS